jgi:RimJ/RimL family protein N-acetyltransferase
MTPACEALGLAEAFRSNLIFLPESGSVRRVGDCVVVLTPDNPTFWWGNALIFDGPPEAGDLDRWQQAFDALIRTPQPASRHTTFVWSGDDVGEIAPFVAEGFVPFDSVALAADRESAIAAPHPNRDVNVEPFDVDDWDRLLELMVAQREDGHPREAYRAFAERRIAGWRRLAAHGQGAWFGAFEPERRTRLLSALGIFVEAQPDADGVRLGRFQHVLTDPAERRRGLAGTLVAHASRFAFERLAATRLLIIADEHDVARRVYASCGFRTAGHSRGLERGGY